MESKRIDLKKGFVEVYDFGEIKLHSYQTNDLMYDESYILENKDNVLLVEFPAFYDNLGEFEEYIKGLNKNIARKSIFRSPKWRNNFKRCKRVCFRRNDKINERRNNKRISYWI